MNKLLALLVLVSTVICLPLEPLCPADQFNYQDVRVNAIHRVQNNVTLEPFSNFVVPLFDNNCLSGYWKYSELQSESEKIKNNFNRLLIRIYSERFLNSKSVGYALDGERDEVNKMIKRMLAIARLENEHTDNCLRQNFIPWMKRGNELIGNLRSLYNQELPLEDEFALKLGKRAVLTKLESEIARITNDLTDNQTMAFRSELMPDVYEKRIARMGKFVFYPKSKAVFNLTSFGVVTYEMIFPFEDTALQAGNNCVSTADLPEFFTQGKIVKASADSSTTPASACPCTC